MTVEQFWARADRSGGPDACWPWLGRRNAKGYAERRVNRGPRFVHRIVFFLVYGQSPEAVCHTCDNPPCINPAHLRSGTRADNAQEMWAKGRARPRGRLPLTETQRAELFTCAGTHAATARRFGVSPETVRRHRAQAARDELRRLAKGIDQ